MNRNRKPLKSKYILVILTIICVSLICLTLTSTIRIDSVRNGAGILIVPLQNGLNKAGSWLSDRQSTQRSAEELAVENAELREKVANLQEQNTVLIENAKELEDLRELYQLDQNYTYFEKVAANIISKDSGAWYDQFTINKGENDGIRPDMNVISDGGLVGIVTETGPNWAQVRSIINENSNVSAMVLLTSDNCIVSGDTAAEEDGKLLLTDLSIDANATVGGKVVTSHISDKYLSGILIGYIDEIKEDQNHLMQTGYIIPAADFMHLNSVLVIKETKDTGEDS
ncbi:MAG: rod shape-determining protein MreC [Eubacterium sp.]|nr:rod shape-determining protein MreC [Eubacterium sp.]